ncbi:baculoviral IAP repeat-containing protein 2-like [Mytilus trossulus]|uniref:baculoviral IAP repeat-containing protein 2-like n=1 Tax=Mytilus trossulus TaxID=6551 RepID=UPI0030058134
MFYEELKDLREKYEALSLRSGDGGQSTNQNIVPGYQQLQKQRSEILPSGQSQTFTSQVSDNDEQQGLVVRSDLGSNLSNTEEDLYEIAKRVHEQQKRRYLFTDLSDSNNNECFERKHKRQNSAQYRTYSNEEVRCKSYQGWKSECNRPTMHFAKSGFFYRGFGDMVTCFQCGLVYKNWSSDADPIIIHSTRQSDCDFISDLKEKGILSCENIITNTDTG